MTAEKIDNRQIKTVKKRGSLPKLTSSPQSKDVFVPLQFLDIPPKELAIRNCYLNHFFSKTKFSFILDITAGDWKYFKRIKITELIHKSWTKEDVSLAPNILALINRFNRVRRRRPFCLTINFFFLDIKVDSK